jgi:hypothetical protein
VVLEDAKVIVHETGSYLDYEVRFQLRETGGKSGATILNVFVGLLNDGGDNFGPGCRLEPPRVPPGGTLDAFDTHEGTDWLRYCAVVSRGYRAPVLQLQVVVTFTDDQGGEGRAAAVVNTDN